MDKKIMAKSKAQIKNKWFETKEDELDMSLNIIDELEQQIKKQKEIIAQANEVIDKMINTGYSNGFTQYCATGTKGEFGVRAKIIQDILNGGDRMNINECIKQLNSLIEHFENGANDFNDTDIVAIRILLKEVKAYDSFKKWLIENNKPFEVERRRGGVAIYERGFEIDKLLGKITELEQGSDN